MLVEFVKKILLNLVVLSLLIGIIFVKGNGANPTEQYYAKNIALLIDSAKPVMEMKLNMEDAFKIAEGNKINREEIVQIRENSVIVKLSSKSEYRYSFFNNVDVTAYPDIFPEKNYIIKINDYQDEKNE